MRKSPIITPGYRQGSWVILGEIPGRSPIGCRFVAAQCDCGRVVARTRTTFTSGSKSCGCQRQSRLRHGYTRVGKVQPEWQAWNHMIQRCTNPNDKHWKDYGARGVSVCQEWASSFESFISDMGDRPTSQHSLDRIDSNGNYCKENCRWADKFTQAQNRRGVLWIEYCGRRLCSAAWSRLTGIKRTTIQSRYHKGWSLDRVFAEWKAEVCH